MRVKPLSPAGFAKQGVRPRRLRSLRPVSPIDVFESDEQAIFEIGSPAYRIARNRSGLGYVETQAELARFEGLTARWLFQAKFHVNTEPTALCAMVCIALVGYVIPVALGLAGALADGSAHVTLLSVTLLLAAEAPTLAVGLFALGSAVASLAAVMRKRRARG